MAEKLHGATGPSTDLGKQEISELDLEELVRQYHDKARQTGQWADYLRSHGGANYLVAIKPTQERLRQVYDIETSWYGGEHPLKGFDEHQLSIKKHKKMLMDYRENTKHDFDSMKSGEEALDTEDIFSETNLNRALDFSQQVFSLSKKCTEGFIDFNHSVIGSCVEVLNKVGQAPPCSFAVIGLGSVARGEATPYSDLEYAFIVEEDTGTSYFQNLAVESYFRIGNLGETPLKTIGIKCTVASVSTCNIPPVGYRIDGISRRAGHIPTGHPDSNQSLILTVDQLMELYKKEVMSSPDSKRAHDLADLMSSSALIYSYQGGAELYEQFLDRRESCEREEVKDNLFAKRKRLDMLSRDITNYSFLPEFDFQQTRNKDVKVKENIFRYPTLLATDLNICLTLNSQYSWNTFTKLHELDILTEQDLRCMHIVLALSIYIRTTAYLTRGGQSELLSIHTAVKDTSAVSDRYYVPLNIFLILGCLLVPIKQSFTLALETANSHKFKNASSDIVSKMQSVMNGLNLSRTDFMLRTQILLFVERYQLALNDLYRMVGEDKVANCAKFINVIRAEYHTDKSNPAEKRYLEMLYAMNFQLGEYEVAIDYLSWLTTYVTDSVEQAYKKIMIAKCMSGLARHRQAKSVANQVLLQMKEALGLDVQKSLIDYIKKKLASEDEFSEHVMACISVTGHAFDALGWSFHGLEQHEPALECFKRSAGIMAGKMINKQFKKKQEMYVCHGGLACEIALSYNNIGNVCNEMGDYKQSLVYYMKALKVSQTVYGGQTNQSGIAMSYSNIGSLYNDLGQYAQSLVYNMKALEMNKAMYGEQANHSEIARSYNNIGNVYITVGDYTQSLVYYMKALEMRKSVYGESTDHSDVARSYNNVGIVYNEIGNHDQSLVYHTKALEMKKALYGEQAAHSEIASSYNNIGNAYNTIGDFSQSLAFYKKALQMRKAVYGEQANHPEIANCYINIGHVYNTMGDYTQSLVYNLKALEMKKAVHGEQANHPDIAMSYNNIGNVHCVMENYAESLVYYMKALEIRKAVYGEQTNHSDVANSYNNIGSVYNQMGDHTQSLVYNMKALEMMKAAHGGQTNRPDIANCYNNLANVHSDVGDYAQSLVYNMKALEMKRAVYGEQTNNSDVANCYNNIGNVYNEMGNYTQSLVYYLKALEMGKAVYAEHNTTSVGRYLVYIYLGIGNLYRSRHQHTEALGLFIPALMIPDKGTSQTATALYGIAQIWVDSHDHKRARQFLHLSMKQSPTSDKLLQARNCHLMGICHLNAGSLSRSWVWLYSALCLHERLPDGVDTEISLAKIHITIATLLLHLFHANIALEHAKKALNISSKLLVRFSGHAECVRVNREAKSLTDSLQLVKIIQNEFPNRV